MALLDHLLGDPDQLPLPGLERGLRRGSESFAVRCVRALGERRDAPVGPLLPLLAREEAGLRRAAARALASVGRPEALGALRAGWAGERTEEGRVALAVARARCGDDPGALALALEVYDRRVLHTVGGARCPASVHGLAPLSERLWAALGEASGEVLPRAELLDARRRALTAGAAPRREDPAREPLQSLALLGAPEDFPTLQSRFRTAGRRGEHTLFLALGLTGDPRAAPLLRDALRATDVDPGRGFAQRRLAATGLGRLGLRQGAPWLARAVQDEAADYEGRPGAGLGIQYPVRTNLLWALGEIADPASLPTLLAHLGDTHGSALGGFYLPAMDALAKLGPVAFPALRDTAARGTEVTAAHAVSVLAAGGEDVRRWARDPRPTVRQLTERVLAGGAPPPARHG
jgi:HEAT repeat protein